MTFVQGIRDTRKFFDKFHDILASEPDCGYAMPGDLLALPKEGTPGSIEVYRYEESMGDYYVLTRLLDGEKVLRDLYECNPTIVGGRLVSLISKQADRVVTEGVTVYPLHDRDDTVVREYDLLKAFKHPRSSDMEDRGIVVSDILHPCLRLIPSHVVREFGSKRSNRFGKEAIDADHQWIPHGVIVRPDGVKIEPGPDLTANPDLQAYLESLLRVMMPGFRSTWKYLESLERPGSDDTFPFDYVACPHKVLDLKDIDVERGRAAELPHKLQFYLKVVDIEIPSDEWYQGVWHLEGMPQEQIVATGIYYLDIQGAPEWDTLKPPELVFKREYHSAEHNYLYSSIGQTEPHTVHELMADFLPLGSLQAHDGHAVFFPNTHVHRVQPFHNTTGETIHRQFVVFFLVDPEVNLPDFTTIDKGCIIDTRETPAALTENMETRMMCKEELNPRDINFCEH